MIDYEYEGDKPLLVRLHITLICLAIGLIIFGTYRYGETYYFL